uniref:Olfactory receptor n=1 Tax=Suricata suricatta TaxID=37032 RepID=A0A673T6T9_SURSU
MEGRRKGWGYDRGSEETGEIWLFGDASYSTYDFLFFPLVLLASTAALVGNVLFILLIQANRHLHTPMYFFLSQLSIMDLIIMSTVVPKMAANLLLGHKVISWGGCAIQVFLVVMVGGAECFLLAVMAYDRYVAVCHPLRYPVLMNWKACSLLALASWMDGLIQAIFTLSFPYCGSQEIDHFFCEVPAILKLACADTSLYETMIYVCCIIMLLLPFSVISASYLRILVAVLHMRSAEGRQKAFATCSSHMAVVSLFYGAAMITYMRPQAYHSSKQDKVVSAFYTMITPMLNPLIYSLRNKEVAGAFRKLLGRCPSPADVGSGAWEFGLAYVV